MPEETSCKLHEERIDDMDAELHKQNGWLKTAGFVFSTASVILGWFGTNITTKLDAISTLLTDGRVVQMQHSEQIKALQTDVKEIQDRHRYLDQNGVQTLKGNRK